MPWRAAIHTQQAIQQLEKARPVTKRRIALIIVGIVVALLGLLWMLHGAGIVHIRPILCVSNCKPVTKSVSWLILGALVLIGGVALAGWNTREASRR